MFFKFILPLIKRTHLHLKTTSVLPQLKGISTLSHPNSPSTSRLAIADCVKEAFQKVRIYVVNDGGVCSELLQTRLPMQEVDFVGLDCEWDSTKSNNSGVSLIQMSTGSDCILYRLSQDQGEFPESLRRVLEDKKVLKFGVAISEDVRRLRSHGVNVRGFVDLRYLADRCLPPVHQSNAEEEKTETDEDGQRTQFYSLRALSNNILQMKLNKNFHIRCGDWQANELTLPQIIYAAKDAIVSLEIFYALILARKLNRSGLQSLATAFDSTKHTVTEFQRARIWQNIMTSSYCYDHQTDVLVSINKNGNVMNLDYCMPSPWLKDLGHSLCQGLVELNYKYKPNKQPKSISKSIKAIASGECQKPCSQHKPYKAPTRDKNKPLYENCYLLGPDSQVLATVNHTKAEWYVKKNLGVVDKEEPYTVRLLFEPSGRPMPDADYYTTEKNNLCVVCGSTDSFVRKMIVPHDYRKYFPSNLKDHTSHDVLLMCLNCHRNASFHDEILRQTLAHDYTAPLATRSQMLMIDDPDLTKVRSAAKALLHAGDKLPQARKEELSSIVQHYRKGEEVTKDMLLEIVKMDVKKENKNFKGLHAQRVIDQVTEQGKLADFIRMWRQHFLDTMCPRFLPPMWSTEHNLKKLDTITIGS